MTFASAFGGSCLLLIYWYIPFAMITKGPINPDSKLILLVLFFYIFGVVLMLISDC